MIWQSLMYIARLLPKSVIVNSNDKDVNVEKPRTSKISKKERAMQATAS